MTFTEQLNALAAFSSTNPETQGVTRLPFTPQQQDAAQWLKRQMEDAGLTARVDAYGTVAGVLPGKSEETLIIGSHYDSVPNGGRYDGCSGVIAGIRVAQALREEGVVPAYTLMILGLNDEEGVALTEGFLSSRGVCGEIDEAALDRVRHRTTGESLRQLTGPERAEHIALPKECRGYLEFHVEWSILWASAMGSGAFTASRTTPEPPPWSCAKTPCRCSGRSRRPCPIWPSATPRQWQPSAMWRWLPTSPT